MNCPIKTGENAEWLLDYCAGRLDRGTAADLERHMESCADCREFRTAQQAVWSALDQWESAPVSEDFDRRLYRRIDRAAPVSWIGRILQPLRPLVLRPFFPLTAACVIVVAGLLLQVPRVGVVPADSEARVERIEPEQVETTLDDMQMLRELSLTPESLEKTSPSM